MKTYHPITGEILEQLRSIVGEKYVWTDPEHLEQYKTDEEKSGFGVKEFRA